MRGKTLAVANPQSLVVLRGLQWLREQGLQEGRDFKISRAGNDDSLGTLIRSGEAPMAMMSMGEFRQIGERHGLTVTVQGLAGYSRRFAGRVETGRDSLSDPALGGRALGEQIQVK